MIGQTVAHYRITAKLGEGGMGVVYRAEDLRLRRQVALKFLSAHLSENEAAQRRFMQEAQAAAGLEHPGICTVHDLGEAGGRSFIVMELVEGRDLARILADGPLPPDQARAVALQVVDALGEAHARGIVHRDLKPANIMLGDRGRAVVMDFGLARLEESLHATRSAALLGTGAYMAPEQLRGGPCDRRTDIWALGVVIYEMLTGRRPFAGQRLEAVALAVLEQTPQPLAAARPGLPAAWQQIIDRALAKDPAQRYDGMEALRRDLLALASAPEDETRAMPGGVKPRSIVSSRWSNHAPRRRRPDRRALTAAGLLLAAAAAVYAVRAARPPSAPSPDKSRTVAVLPLRNLSDDTANDYFSDGVSEDIITQLSRIGQLTVISPSSSARYKGSDRPLREIASELRADVILTGSVRRAGDQVRITASLVDGRSEKQLWRENYDRRLDDIFSIQSDVAAKIAEVLRARLTRSESLRLETPPTRDIGAYDYYLQGRQHYGRYNKAANETAIALFERALQLDPEFALAYAGLADAFAQNANRYGLPLAWADSGIAMARRAIAIDPELPEAHKSLGTAFTVRGRQRQALAATRRAVELNPNYAAAVGNLGAISLTFGELGEALRWLKRASALSPTAAVFPASVGLAYFCLGDHPRARSWFDRALGIQPDYSYADTGLGYLALAEGDTAAAVRLGRRILSASPDDFFGLHLAGDAALAAGDHAAAAQHYARLARTTDSAILYSCKRPQTGLGYARLALGERAAGEQLLAQSLERDRQELDAGSENPDIHYNTAAVLSARGEADGALAALRRAVEQGWRAVRLAERDPLLAPLRGDPRFARTLETARAKLAAERLPPEE